MYFEENGKNRCGVYWVKRDHCQSRFENTKGNPFWTLKMLIETLHQKKFRTVFLQDFLRNPFLKMTLDFWKHSNGKCWVGADTILSVWTLPKVQIIFQKHISSKVFVNYFSKNKIGERFDRYLKEEKKIISLRIFKSCLAIGGG